MLGAFEVSMKDKKAPSMTVEAYADNLEKEGKDQFLDKFGDIMVMAIARYAPRSGVGAQGGKLATTAYYKTAENSMSLYLQDYWPYVEFETKPHVILPKRPGGVLAFPRPGANIGGRIELSKEDLIFTKKVNHPGTKAQFFIAKSWNRSRVLVEKLLDRWAKGELQ